MPWLTQLADVARRTGCPVTEVRGWKTRGHGPQPEVQGVVCHHTAGPAGGGDYPSLRVVRSGRPGLKGPLSHIGLGRSGRIYVIAAGRCWHNAPSTSPLHDNSSSIGIEAENDGSQPWLAEQLDAYHRLCAELCKEFGLPASRVKGHKEVNRQKPDPHHIAMDDFRSAVARLIKADQDGDGWPGRLLRYPPVTRGEDVRDWQQAAARLGYELDIDGAYGSASRAVCRKIQRDAGLDDDGIVGRLTWAATFHAR
ncbi:peptidoglycan recognition protein family protein [Nonomuraea helvata]|uniref:N-acetylmuramoyl-L-alanine amidase n=1 Tax=Nonomuraea helvata TaxID=37484 RepID=A0ABV5SIK9_9ACTN